MTWYCGFVWFYETSGRMLECYLGYLRDNDYEGLAAWLAMDGPPWEALIQSAKDTAEYYNS